MQIYDTKETKSTAIPISELLTDGKLDVLQDVQHKAYFNIKLDGNSIILKAGNFIGLIPLNERIAIHVKTKLPFNNLMRVLSIANLDNQELDLRRYYDPYDPSDYKIDLFLHIIKAFAMELRNAQKYGFQKEYQKFSENDFTPRGKILFNKTAISNKIHFVGRLPYLFYNLDLDNAENRLIRYTLWIVLSYGRELKVPSNILHELSYFFRMLQTVPLDKSRRYVPLVRQNILKGVYPTIRHFYVNLLRICLLIICKYIVNVEINGKYVELPSYVFDMSIVFQNYLLRMLGSRLGINRVVDGNKRRYNKPLFEDSSQPLAEPDLIIRNKHKETKVIADSKYKESPQRDDFNQLISYCLSYNSQLGLFICPKSNDGIPTIQYIGNISGIKLSIYYLDMNTEDILTEEQKLADYIESLMNNEIQSA
jgi:5-methylcytosine-specific restriction enzyme subunit McrC